VKGILGANKMVLKGSKTKFPKKIVGTGGKVVKPTEPRKQSTEVAAAVTAATATAIVPATLPKGSAKEDTTGAVTAKKSCSEYQTLRDSVSPTIAANVRGFWEQSAVTHFCMKSMMVWLTVSYHVLANR
jgi:hypothetical protein